MKIKYIATLFSSVLVAIVLTGCGQSSASSDKNRPLTVTLSGEPATADPAQTTDVNSSTIVSQTMQGLYTLSSSGKVVSSVAKQVVKPTDGGKRYVFNLRKTKWSNGQEVTAKDFVAGFQRAVNPKTKSQRLANYKFIKNFKAVSTGKAPVSKFGVKALSKYRFEIQLSAPVPYFNYLLTDYYPINQSAAKKFGSSYGTSSDKLVTNGPYKLIGWNGTSTSFKLKRNPNYNIRKVRISTVNVRVEKDSSTALNLFKANKVQITQLTGQLVKANANNSSLKTTKILRNAYLEFNSKSKTTNNTNLHKAISYALDREQLTKSVLQDGSVAAWSMVPQGDATNPTTGEDFAKEVGNKLKVNTKAAKSYWKKAQSELGKKQISVQLLTGDDDASKQVGEYMQAVVKKELPGLTLTLKAVPQAQHIQMGSDKNYEINLDGWSTGLYDPADFLQMAEYGNALSFSNWKDATYQKLISQINDTTKYSEKQRYDLMIKADKYLMQQQGIVPLYQVAQSNLVDKRLGGISFTALSGIQYQYAYWKS